MVPFTDIVLAKPICQFMWMTSSWWLVKNFAFPFIEISKKMKAKLDGRLGCGRDGVLYYLKRQLEFSESGIDLSCNAKYIPKLVEMLHVTERRGKSVPGHHGLQVYDSETISESEFLNTKEFAFTFLKNV